MHLTFLLVSARRYRSRKGYERLHASEAFAVNYGHRHQW